MVAMIFAMGCGSDSGDSPAASSDPSSEEPETSAATTEATPALAPEAPARVRFDFVGHLPRAELRQGNTLLIDFGVPGGSKYTLGGWQTRTGDDHDFDGTSALLFPRVTGQLLLPSPSTAAAMLRLRARSFGDGRLTVYIGERSVAHARLPRDGSFETVVVPLEEGTLVAGENQLQLRVASTGSAPGVRQAGLAIDWLSLGPAEEPEASPPSPRELTPEPATLAIADGLALGYALEVPAAARLRGQVVGDGLLAVVAHRDGAPPLELASLRGTTAGAPLDVDLSALAGHVARLDLVARGALRVRDAAVVTLDGGATLTERRRPENVLVYLIDTLRADRLTPWNAETRVRTPGLDRYVRQAAVFEQGRTNENWTKPSIATLLSSLMPWQHQATTGEAVVPRSVELLPELLQGRGFHTGAFICNGYVSGTFGFRQGWSTWRNYIKEGRRTQARFVAADVLAWLDERPEDKPFFLYVHTIDPHVPYIPPDDILESYDPDPYDGPVDFRGDRELLEKIKSGQLHVNARDRQRLEALYDGEITYHDVHMAAILDGLERRGLAENTMVVITSDHGEEFFDHDSVGHGHSLFEELLHVPLVMRVPGVTDGAQRIEEPTSLVDVMPTILDALGQEMPPGISGRSVLPLLRGGSESAPRISVAAFMGGWRSVLVGHRKLIHRTARRWMLYDLARDPGETNDVAAERPLEVRYLRGLLGLGLVGADGAVHEAETTVIDAQTEAQLRALGYVGTSRR